MELKEMSKVDYDRAIDAIVAVKQIRDYIAECEENGIMPDVAWIKHLME